MNHRITTLALFCITALAVRAVGAQPRAVATGGPDAAPEVHADEPHDLRSAGKSLVSLLAGIAVDDGRLTAETRVAPLFAKRFADRCKLDPRIRVRDLLTMSSGLDADDDDEQSVGNEMHLQNGAPDWTAFTVGLSSVRPPGERAVYGSANLHLAAAAVAEATGEWLPRYFDARIARPLGIEHYHWNLTPTGDGYGGGGARLRPRDLLKIGQTFLDGGRWNGAQVISREWVEESTRPHVGIHQPLDYGYAWWRQTYRTDDGDHPAFYASGNGGQLLIVVPSAELVVLFHAANYSNYGTWRRFRDELVPEFILAALE